MVEGRTFMLWQRWRKIGTWLTLASLLALPGCGPGDGSTPEIVWGVRGSKPGWLLKPRAAAYDRDDQLYLVDLTDRVQVFDREGK